jgi:hypothetical protein
MTREQNWRCAIVSLPELSREIGLGIGQNDDSLPPPAERRPKTRKRVLLGGIVTFAGGAQSFACTFRNLSENGARILVPKSVQFPSDFYLINIRAGLVYEASAVWNREGEVGVTFKKVLSLSDITDPSLGFLKRLWVSKATR